MQYALPLCFIHQKNTTLSSIVFFGGDRGIRHPLRVLYLLHFALSINSLKKVHWTFFFTLIALSGSNHLCFIHQKNTTLSSIVLFGGDRGIRHPLRVLYLLRFALSINSLKKVHWTFFFTLIALSGSNHLCFMHQKNTTLSSIVFFGGDRGIRTLAALANPNSLANCPLRPAWVCLHGLQFY